MADPNPYEAPREAAAVVRQARAEQPRRSEAGCFAGCAAVAVLLVSPVLALYMKPYDDTGWFERYVTLSLIAIGWGSILLLYRMDTRRSKRR